MNPNERLTISCIQLYLSLIGIKNKPFNFKELDNNLHFNDFIKELNVKNNVKILRKNTKKKNIEKIRAPSILFNHQGKPFILAKTNKDKCLIQEANKETPYIIPYESLISLWSGQWLDIKIKQSRFDIRWFIPEFLKHKKLLAELFLFSFVLQLLALISPLFFQVVMDKVLVHHALSTLDVLVFGLVVAGVIEVLLRGLREYQYAHTANRIDIQLGLKLVRHLFGLPLLFFKSRQVGAIVTRVRELDTVREFLTGSMFTLTVELLFMFVFVYVMSLLSTSLTWLFVSTIPLYVLLAWWLTPRMQSAVENQFTHAAANTSFLTETVAGSETVKSLAVEPRFVRRWDQQTEKMVSTGYAVQQLNHRSHHLVMLLQKVTSVAILWLGATEVLALQMTIGQLIAFNMITNHVAQPLARMVELWGQFIQTRVAVEKLGDMLNLPPEQQTGSSSPSLVGAISFKDIVFRYQPDLPPTINGLSLDIRAGETLGVVGTSGSGKSTLARLLLRLYSPEKGQIAVDGIPLNQICVQRLRQQIGVVLQENFLFNKSVSDNIAQSRPDASLEEIIDVAILSGAHEFILKLPMGYDTVLAEGGQSLSGGQRQRLAIARTLLSNPKILILDEATSALDDESQALIQSNMSNIAKGRTVITIAHRLSTVRNCDRILVLHQGNIVEQGSHQALLNHGQQYKQLWQLQQELKQERQTQ
ncbi:RTX toxin transporter [Vibrio nigripulchritudo SFn27]|uniref:RTX toxin transporter (RtxB) n=1 Tax=Vibrio nigripulchritudo TaxID=28173 RepID=A0A9P1NJZ5_9VIBR|nr:type I secretion system permease/ATPase [Vibrio nigripulchritudo]CBJ93230.1 Putative RTX toxin transporter (RtxB) [Vibrio nigripulchritudo]CCN86054.1 RTX toxin transporter [Vibrio nigripulchritudo BLFn1]CCN92041.1 RTX toxin transporter [Vibrio nigripulchritudo SFn27]CCN97852.1 RTX toxin transporter [Vibrio nigripulchritudo ENn2]CCO44075.1 RTX toxin transporter [Vibrio nigripulchritudo SFn135]